MMSFKGTRRVNPGRHWEHPAFGRWNSGIVRCLVRLMAVVGIPVVEVGVCKWCRCLDDQYGSLCVFCHYFSHLSVAFETV